MSVSTFYLLQLSRLKPLMDATLLLLQVLIPRLISPEQKFKELLVASIALFLSVQSSIGLEEKLKKIFDSLINNSGKIIGGSAFGTHLRVSEWRGRDELQVREWWCMHA